MMHLLIVEYTGSEQEAEPYFREHAAYLDRHHRAGTSLVSALTKTRACPATKRSVLVLLAD
jgi:pyrroloquinoline quinone (PQQ) biosynthesis protein C